MTQEQKNEIKVGAMIIAKWDHVWREYGFISNINLDFPEDQVIITWLTIATTQYETLPVSPVHLKDYGYYWKVIS